MAIKEDLTRIDPIEVDITDTSLAEGMEQEMDLKEDWQARACPPPAGRYRLKLFIGKEDFEQGFKQGFGKDDPNGKYYKAQVTCKIQDPTGAWQDSVVFYNASTGISKGKSISTMAGLLVMMGDTKLPKKITELALAKRFFAAITKNEPVLIADCDWSAWDGEAKKKGQELGSLLKAGMKNFPPIMKEGKVVGYSHILTGSKGNECVAKLKIMKWVKKAGAGDAAPVAETPKPQEVVVAPKATKMAIATPEPVVEDGDINFNDDGEIDLS